MPLFLAEMSRGISRHRLGLYPHVREVLNVLREHYPLALDGWACRPRTRCTSATTCTGTSSERGRPA
jgi:hypothetical protein